MTSQATSLYDLSYTSITGEEIDLSQYEGRPVLIVNTARKCGFAPQFKTLQSLHKEYGPQGLVVLGFPCDQFAHQEPGDDETIAEACEMNFGVTFPLSTKIDVNGDDTHPVFRFLRNQSGGRFGSRIKWNFTKFLIAPDGTTVKRFGPQSSPKQVVPLIQDWLTEPSDAGADATSSSSATSPSR